MAGGAGAGGGSGVAGASSTGGTVGTAGHGGNGGASSTGGTAGIGAAAGSGGGASGHAGAAGVSGAGGAGGTPGTDAGAGGPAGADAAAGGTAGADAAAGGAGGSPGTDAGSGGFGTPDAGTGPICEQPTPSGIWGAIASTNNPRIVEAIAPGEVWIGPKGVVRWSGTDWVTRFTGFQNFGVVRGTSADNIWVTNSGTSIERWDGAGWTDISPPGLPSNAQSVDMRVLSASEAWVLYTVMPQSGSLVLHRDSTGWTQIPLPPEAQLVPNIQYAELSLLWATSSNDVWMGGRVYQLGVGTTAAFLHWDGTTLVAVPGSPFSPGGQYYPTAIWAAAANDVWVGGVTLTPNALGTLQHFDGVRWTDASLSTLGPVAIWGWCSSSVWLVLGGSVQHFDGSAWTSTGLGNGSELSGTGPNDIWLSGPWTATNVRHWQPNTCGDGVIGPGETCDPPRGPSSNGGLLCDATCHIPTCGNGVIDPGETCDPPNFTTCDTSCQTIPIVCGDGIQQTGEQCDYGPTTPAICQNCQLTNCGACFGSVGGAGLCSGLNVADTQACSALVTCAANDMASCASSNAAACYCSGPTLGVYTSCSAGTNGPCVAQFQALAHSNDPTVVLQQVNNPATLVGKVAAVMHQFGTVPCGPTCFLHNN